MTVFKGFNKMFHILLLNLALLINKSMMVFSQNVFHPYGPRMCEILCKSREACSTHIFDEVQLSCRLVFNTSSWLTGNKPSSKGKMDLCESNITTSTPPPKSDRNTIRKRAPRCDSYARPTFLRALINGQIRNVKILLSTGLVNVNCSFKSGMTAVMIAADKKHEKIFDFLLSKRCDLKAVDKNRCTVLHYACRGASMYIIKKLLDIGIPDINCREKHMYSPLTLAVRYGHTEIINIFRNSGADYTKLDKYNNNILHQACLIDNLKMVKYVHSLGLVSIDSRGRYGRTPLMLAAAYGYRSIFNFLKESGAESKIVDYYKNNILHLVCQNGHTDLAELILSLKMIDIESRALQGRTPLMIALLYGHLSIARMLRQRGADVNAKDDMNNNLLHVVCYSNSVDSVKYITSQHIFYIESRGYNGRTPLMCGVLLNRRKVVDFLVESGADINAIDDHNKTLLHHACQRSHISMVEYVLSLTNSEIEAKERFGRTPLLLAVKFNDIKVVQLLVKHNANLTSTDDLDRNVLHIAAGVGKLDMVRYLVSLKEVRGFEQRHDKDGNTPVQLAGINGHCDIVSFLKAGLGTLDSQN